MSILLRLRPFVSLFQACGFIPYAMEYDPNTEDYIKFTFSWRNYVTWWFILLAVLQIGLPIISGQRAGTVIGQLKADREAPITITVLMIVTVICFFVEFILSRTVILQHYRRLKNAVALALKIERLLQRTYQPSYEISIKYRFFIGFCLLAISVSILPKFARLSKI